MDNPVITNAAVKAKEAIFGGKHGVNHRANPGRFLAEVSTVFIDALYTGFDAAV